MPWGLFWLCVWNAVLGVSFIATEDVFIGIGYTCGWVVAAINQYDIAKRLRR